MTVILVIVVGMVQMNHIFMLRYLKPTIMTKITARKATLFCLKIWVLVPLLVKSKFPAKVCLVRALITNKLLLINIWFQSGLNVGLVVLIRNIGMLSLKKNLVSYSYIQYKLGLLRHCT